METFAKTYDLTLPFIGTPSFDFDCSFVSFLLSTTVFCSFFLVTHPFLETGEFFFVVRSPLPYSPFFPPLVFPHPLLTEPFHFYLPSPWEIKSRRHTTDHLPPIPGGFGLYSYYLVSVGFSLFSVTGFFFFFAFPSAHHHSGSEYLDPPPSPPFPGPPSCITPIPNVPRLALPFFSYGCFSLRSPPPLFWIIRL